MKSQRWLSGDLAARRKVWVPHVLLQLDVSPLRRCRSVTLGPTLQFLLGRSYRTPAWSPEVSPPGCDGSQMDYCANGRWALTSAQVELLLVVCREEKGCNSCVGKVKGDFQALKVM